MNTPASYSELANGASEHDQTVRLSIAIPFYNDDPGDLVRALNPLIGADKSIEILLFDDCSTKTHLNALTARTIRALTAPARLLTARENCGRAHGRNILAREARGEWILYLDADMAPTDDVFLSTYGEAMDTSGLDAIFGGYLTRSQDADQNLALHAALASASDHCDAAAREKIGATAFCSSNLLVRRELMLNVPFDTGFVGWGWEDVDWAVAASRQHKLGHIDNPALHDGLQPVDVLLDKFRIGATNYARMLEKHPDLRNLPGAKAARAIRRVPFNRSLRAVWANLARSNQAPMRLRTLGLKLWRASWTAEVI